MQNPSERHKLTSDNNIIKFKKPVHEPFKINGQSLTMPKMWSHSITRKYYDGTFSEFDSKKW